MNAMVFLYILSSVYTVDIKEMPDYKTCRAAMAVLDKATADNRYTSGPKKVDCYIVDEGKGGFIVLNGRDVELERQRAEFARSEIERLSRETTTETPREIKVTDPSKSIKLQQFLSEQEKSHE